MKFPILPNGNANMTCIESFLGSDDTHNVARVDEGKLRRRKVQFRFWLVSVFLTIYCLLIGFDFLHKRRISFQMLIKLRMGGHVIDRNSLCGKTFEIG